MAVAPSIPAPAVTASVAIRAMRWGLPFVAAALAGWISAAIDGQVRWEVGVVVAARVVGGWPGMLSALVGVVLADEMLAPNAVVAAQFSAATALCALVSGVAYGRSVGARPQPGAVLPFVLLGWSVTGATLGAALLVATDAPITAAWRAGVGLCAGVMLVAPLMLDALTRIEWSRLAAPAAILVSGAALAALSSFAPTAASLPSLIYVGAMFVAAVAAADRMRIALGMSCASVAAVLVGLSPLGYPLLVSAGAIGMAMAVLSVAARAAGRSAREDMLRFIPVGIARVGLDGRLMDTNPTFHALTGLSDTASNWLASVDGEDRARIAAAWAVARQAGTAFDESFRVADAQPRRWVSVRIAPEMLDGQTVGFIGSVSDVTKQRTFEEARDRLQAQSEAVLHTAVDAIATIDVAGIVLSFNRAAQRMFGYTPDEILGRNVEVLMPEPHRSGHDAYIAAYLRTGQPRIIGIGRELEARRKDGSLLPISLAVSEVVVDGQRTFTGIMRDMSLARSAQEEIRRQNERLLVTVRNAPMGIVTYRFGESFASTNQAFESMLGFAGAELERHSLTSLTHPDDQADLAKLVDDAHQGRVEQFSLQLRLLHKSGTPIHVIVHNAVTHDQHGAPDLVIAQVEDLTTQIQAKEVERQQQDRLTHVARLSTLGEMTAGIAHEINQPLTAISMYAQSGVRMLDGGVPKPERLREALEKLTAQSLRAGAVIDRIQRLVRRQETLLEAVQLNELIHDILRLAESDARVNDIQIALDLGENLPIVNADPIQIQQVVLNLLRNGIDAMRSIGCSHGSTIRVITRASGRSSVMLSVCDSGTGVSTEFAAQLFTPFATTKDNGMGMGLSICRSIIEAHGGQLGYQNNSDHGATFYFNLPAGHSHAES